METKNEKKEKRILTPIISIVLTIVISCFVTFLLKTTSDVIGFGNSKNNAKDTTNTIANVTDTIQNTPIDSIKNLNETILEIKKELEELKTVQPTNIFQAVPPTRRSVSNTKPNTTIEPQTKKDTTDILPQENDTSIIKPKMEIDSN